MRSLVCLALVLPLAACGATSSSRSTSEPGQNPDARKQFEQMKSLAGQWAAAPDQDHIQKVSYSLVSGGSAVLERLAPGTPHEMLTLYHLDGADLVLTHYCVLGNQPRMRAVPTTADGSVTFDFVGGANIDPEHTLHMHQGRFQFIDRDHVNTEWHLYDHGKETEVVRLALQRVGTP